MQVELVLLSFLFLLLLLLLYRYVLATLVGTVIIYGHYPQNYETHLLSAIQ